MEPFFQFILAESWGCPGMLRMPSGFKAWRLFAHGLQTLSRLLNARALSGSNPQRPFSIIKKGPRWDPSLKLNWRRAGDSNPRCPFGAYSLSRRAPSASRSALRNSRSIVTKQPRMGKRKFSNCLASFPPWRLRLPQRAVEGAELVVAHGAPHLEDATACQEKEAVVDQLHSGICQLIRHGGHWRQL